MREYNLSTARWRKSSYSDQHGGDCIEVAYGFVGAAQWRKSSHSNGEGGNCVAVAAGLPGVVPVRDSKTNPDGGPVVLIGAPAWTTFLTAVCGGASTPR